MTLRAIDPTRASSDALFLAFKSNAMDVLTNARSFHWTAGIARRVFEFVDPDASGCWLWTGELNDGGYGTFRQNRRKHMAHRAIYELANGPIPPGLQLDHLCRVRNCVNPAHLEPVTPSENIQRAWVARDRAAGAASGLASAALSFEDAARRCGHDPDTTCGAEAARHDLRVWDLIQHSA